jgi:restriction system protein
VAEITVQRRGQLMRGVFKILLEEPNGLPAREVLLRLESLVPPTPFENSTYPRSTNVRRRDKIVRFASIPVVKAGWLQKEKGTWWVTEEGREAYEKYKDPAEFIREAVKLYRVWADARDLLPDVDDEVQDEAVATSSILEEAIESAWSEISEHMNNMNPYEFQRLVAGLLKAMGYYISYISPPGPDRGVDILAYTDPLGATGPRIKVQVKRQSDRVSVDGLRSFVALLGDQDVGIFVSTSGFTKDAEREARSQSRRLTLIGLEQLFDLWTEHYSKVSETDRDLLPLRPVYFLDPRE